MLPGQQIAVMLHNADYHFISGFQQQASQAVSDQIQAFRCISGKNDLFRTGCTNKVLYRFTGIFITFRRILTQLI